MSNRAIFFDRDGTLNLDTGFLHDKSEFVWIDGAIDALKLCRKCGFLTIVVTNQSGIARGFYTEADTENLHLWMNEELDKLGAKIDGFYYCPHHPEGKLAKYRKVCACRKPAPGMIERAAKDFDIDRALSYLIGDRQSDMDAAKAAGVRGLLYQGGNLADFLRQHIDELA